MKCQKCGAELTANAVFCTNCGEKVQAKEKGISQIAAKYKNDRTVENFEELYRASYAKVYGYIQMYTHNIHQTEDVLQNSYIICFTKIDQLKDTDKFIAWMKNISYHEMIHIMNDQKEEISIDDGFGEKEENLLSDMINVPEKQMEESALKDLVLECINKLPSMQKLSVLAFYYENKPIKDISLDLNIPENTVKTYLSRGRKLLNRSIGEYANAYGLKLIPFAAAPFLLNFFSSEAKACELGAEKSAEMLWPKIAVSKVVAAVKSKEIVQQAEKKALQSGGSKGSGMTAQTGASVLKNGAMHVAAIKTVAVSIAVVVTVAGSIAVIKSSRHEKMDENASSSVYSAEEVEPEADAAEISSDADSYTTSMFSAEADTDAVVASVTEESMDEQSGVGKTASSEEMPKSAVVHAAGDYSVEQMDEQQLFMFAILGSMDENFDESGTEYNSEDERSFWTSIYYALSLTYYKYGDKVGLISTEKDYVYYYYVPKDTVKMYASAIYKDFDGTIPDMPSGDDMSIVSYDAVKDAYVYSFGEAGLQEARVNKWHENGDGSVDAIIEWWYREEGEEDILEYSAEYQLVPNIYAQGSELFAYSVASCTPIQ